MKLGYRDRIILLVVIVLVILVLGGVLLVKPQWTKLKDNKAKRENLREEWSQTLQTFKNINPMRDSITNRRDDAYDISQIFTPEMSSLELDRFMQETFLNNDKFKEDEVTVRSTATFTDETTTSLGYYYYTPSVVTYPLYEGADFDGSLMAAVAEKLKEANALGARTSETVGAGNVELTLLINREDAMSFADEVRKYAEEHKDAMLIQSIQFKEYDFNGEPAGNAQAPAATDEEGNPIPQQQKANADSNIIPGYTEVTFVYQVFYMQEPTEVEGVIGPVYDEKVWDKEWKSYTSTDPAVAEKAAN